MGVAGATDLSGIRATSLSCEPVPSSALQGLLEEGVHQLRVGLAPSLPHHLSDEPAERAGLSLAIGRHLVRAARHHLLDRGLDERLVGKLRESLALDDRSRALA